MNSGGAERIDEVFRRFEARCPSPKSELDWQTPFTLLVSVVLSAQATDKSVNAATPALFARASAPLEMAQLGKDGIEPFIRSIGLYRTKALHIEALSKMLLKDFAGVVPRTREELMKLPGVGRKTANVVLNVAFGESTMPVDTHVSRVAGRLFLVTGTLLQIEERLTQIIPARYMPHAHHWLLLHGRYTCTARKPKCGECIVSDLCPAQKPAGEAAHA